MQVGRVLASSKLSKSCIQPDYNNRIETETLSRNTRKDNCIRESERRKERGETQMDKYAGNTRKKQMKIGQIKTI